MNFGEIVILFRNFLHGLGSGRDISPYPQNLEPGHGCGQLNIARISVFSAIRYSFSLNHLAAFWIIFVSSLIPLFFVFKTQVGQINVHLEEDSRAGSNILSMAPKIVIYLNWQRAGKRVFTDDSVRIKNAIGRRQFPVAFQFGGDEVTVVVDYHLDGIRNLISDVMSGRRYKFHSSANSGNRSPKA